MSGMITEEEVSAHCTQCQKSHSLPVGGAKKEALKLMHRLEEEQRIDLSVSAKEADPNLAISYLFGPARGQMFGLLECLDRNARQLFLKAFSGQYNGIWQVDGWVPPLLNVQSFDKLVVPVDREIKKLTRMIGDLSDGPKKQELTLQRKKLSQQLMHDIHELYELNNFRSEVAPLSKFFSAGIPTGTADCCAPKLLNYAAQHELTPVSIAEFYWGCGNRSATRQHAEFYAPCFDKCQPILGFMLCGHEEL